VTYVQVTGGNEWVGPSIGYSAALRSDGSIIGWGDCFFGVCTAPALPPGVTYVEIAGGARHLVARRSDGVVVAWGGWPDETPDEVPPLPSGLTYIDIEAGGYYGVARRSDGATIAWGEYYVGKRYLPALPEGLDYVGVEAANVGRYVGCSTCYPSFCVSDGSADSVRCLCGNDSSAGGGCDNSRATGGARLTSHGSVVPDRVVLEAQGVIRGALSLFLQGRSALGSPVVFGDGVRCIGGPLIRLATESADVHGSATYPGPAEPSIGARSAALGDLILPGTYRYYQVYYRDPDPSFCSPSTFNVSSAVMVAW
jgi:hypothetical protein